ncbi:MAG: hypothetical protein KDE53_31360, partial [Caldilineaceae bacterium]|nr:hypothetical protein [Caldilineaceae bacterium]
HVGVRGVKEGRILLRYTDDTVAQIGVRLKLRFFSLATVQFPFAGHTSEVFDFTCSMCTRIWYNPKYCQ